MNELEQETKEKCEECEGGCEDCKGGCEGGCKDGDCCKKEADSEIPEGCCGGGCCM